MVARDPSPPSDEAVQDRSAAQGRFDYHEPLLHSLRTLREEVTGNPEKAAELLIRVGLVRRLPDGSLEDVHDVRDLPPADD